MAAPSPCARPSQRDRASRSGARSWRPRRTPRLEENVALVREINAALAKRSYSFGEAPYLVRGFNNGDEPGFAYQWGGRLTCVSGVNYQNIASEERLRVRIDGQPVTEIDVRASHLSICYALSGAELDLSRDPYDVEGVERLVVKRLIAAAFGGKRMPSRVAAQAGRGVSGGGPRRPAQAP